MEQQFHNPRLVQSYVPLLRYLSSDDKLDLAELLIEMVRRPEPVRSIEYLFGAWESEETAEDLIADIEGSRTSSPEREAL